MAAVLPPDGRHRPLSRSHELRTIPMSVFTNPANRADEAARAYVSAILDLLGDRDPMAVLEATPSAIEEIVKGLTDEQLLRPEAPGKWSLLEVLHHLADSELVWAYRLRMVMAHDRPTLGGYDQDQWAQRLGYRNAALDDLLELFRVVRAANLRLLRAATPDDLKRVAVHAERGDESLEQMIRLDAGHDLVHLRQIERVRQAVSR